MPRTEILNRIQKYIDPFRITKPKGFHLKDFDPGDTLGLKMEKSEAADLLQLGIKWLAEDQDMFYARDRWSLLLVFQAMDAGKDGTIKHVMSGINPQGCQVVSFKQPSQEDLDHDFLWRYARRLPERGCIGIFNRSYYEEVLVARVHKDVLNRQKLPAGFVTKNIWIERLSDIANFEDYLTRQGRLFSNSSYTSHARSRRSGSSSALKSQISIGNSRRLTFRSENSGGTTCTSSKTPSGPRPRKMHPGSSC